MLHQRERGDDESHRRAVDHELAQGKLTRFHIYTRMKFYDTYMYKHQEWFK